MNDATQTTTVEVDTRPSAGAEAVRTDLLINWAGMTPQEIQELAQQALVVKLQGKWRKDGIPAGEHKVDATDYKVGTRGPRTKPTLESLFAAMSAEDRAAFLAAHAG